MSSAYQATQPTSFQQLSLLLETQPETFASGSREIQDAALRSTEHVFNLGALLASWRHRLETLTTFMQLWTLKPRLSLTSPHCWHRSALGRHL